MTQRIYPTDLAPFVAQYIGDVADFVRARFPRFDPSEQTRALLAFMAQREWAVRDDFQQVANAIRAERQPGTGTTSAEVVNELRAIIGRALKDLEVIGFHPTGGDEWWDTPDGRVCFRVRAAIAHLRGDQ